MASLVIKQKLLIHQLRKTGITKEKLLEIFEGNDIIEEESIQQPVNLQKNKDYQGGRYVKFSIDGQESTSDPKTCKIEPIQDQIEYPKAKTTIGKVREFMRKGEPHMLMEIKDFIEKHKIRYVVVADMTNITPQGISKYLKGYPLFLSIKAKLRLYTWYVMSRDQPDIVAECYPQWVDGATKTDPFKFDKKLRFVYRMEHLVILNRYFKSNPYPNKGLKEKIADECNRAIQEKGNPLPYGEKVNPYMVNSWFSNKRREARMRQIKIK